MFYWVREAWQTLQVWSVVSLSLSCARAMGGAYSGGMQGEHDLESSWSVSWMGGGLLPRILFGPRLFGHVKYGGV